MSNADGIMINVEESLSCPDPLSGRYRVLSG
jgi:hypothetical protein